MGVGRVTKGNDASSAAAASPPPSARGHHGFGFGDVLSCLNPLQYLPVVGTLYRAVTGDTIPDTVREAGSLVVSGLTGGPIGVAMSVGVDLVERAAGFDQEKFSQQVLASLGIGHGAASAATSPAATGTVDTVLLRTQAAPFAIPAGAPADADTLNGMELARLASTSYGRAASLTA